MSRLTHKKKMEFFQIIVERDGYRCFYCKEEFSENRPAEYDHLNNNPDDNMVENIVLNHHECNNKKKFNTDWQIKAQEKLCQNERTVLACERTLADTGTVKELTSSQETGKSVRPIALQWLKEHLLMEKEILLSDAVPAMVNLCQNQVQGGSQAAIRRYIDDWSNRYNGNFTLSKNESGKNIIRRRTEN